jgi:hypothetical protein
MSEAAPDRDEQRAAAMALPSVFADRVYFTSGQVCRLSFGSEDQGGTTYHTSVAFTPELALILVDLIQQFVKRNPANDSTEEGVSPVG